ncbi:hypothetical protein H8R03_30385 [Streptomyces sp. JH010]|uniref:tetratricopeptide repeat protein n=1 Tax=Streptomyces sp. JH010 TaxID=2763535 RepID=UPI0023F7C504|nr:hypothetical protein [Streptomyces sp. JH010]MDF6066229.1 hypothetical protein [Streptomyces sp. JH010]
MQAHRRPAIARSAFQEVLLGLEYGEEREHTADIFSRACVESFRESEGMCFGYRFTQVFEATVLHEVAVLEQVPPEQVARLDHRPTATMRQLGDALDHRADLTLVQRVNLASALLSIARPALAETVLTEVRPLAASHRERFEIAWLTFVLSNRQDDTRGSSQAFAVMRDAITAGEVPPGRALDACAQGVVWYLKRREITHDDFVWSVHAGNALARRAQTQGEDPSTVSSWYRGLAMLPAAKGMAEKTRSYMESARAAAEETIRRRPRAYELNLMKTYHESSLKEHMYVTGDMDAAVESGRELIALDPQWSISYGELAEAYVRFGQPREAAELYDAAASMGAPYVGHHLLKAAVSWDKAGEPASALARYENLATLVPGNVEVLTRALECAHRLSHPSVRSFEAALEHLDAVRAAS